jgi:hypothetical protein
VGAALRFRLWEWAAPDGGNPQRHVPRIERCLYRERVGAPRAQRIDQRAEYGLGSSVVLGQVAAGRELLLQAHDRFLRVGERGRPRALTVPHAARIDQAFDDGAIVVTPTTPIRAEFVPFLSSGELDHSRAEVIEPNASGHRFTVCRSGTRLLWVVPRTTDGVNATLQVPRPRHGHAQPASARAAGDVVRTAHRLQHRVRRVRRSVGGCALGARRAAPRDAPVHGRRDHRQRAGRHARTRCTSRSGSRAPG